MQIKFGYLYQTILDSGHSMAKNGSVLGSR